MDVLQIGPQNWANQYQIPTEIHWHFNTLVSQQKAKNKITQYAAVIITGKNKLPASDWKRLQWLVAPYTVLYLLDVKKDLTPPALAFLKMEAAQAITNKPQRIIAHLLSRFFIGQSGIRYLPTDLLITNKRIEEFEYLDAGHLKITLNTHDHWVNIGNYKSNFYVDPYRIFKIWLSLRTLNIKVRLRLYPALVGTDGSVENFEIINIDPHTKKEYQLKMKPDKRVRMISASLEAKGNGAFILGILHWRWSRAGFGDFIAGGRRIVDQVNHDDLAYYLNPGDLKPPLNVYFAGARGLEGFEAYPLFRRMHAPSLLFTDMRLEYGEFYEDASQNVGKQIEEVIKRSLKQLGFTTQQLVVTGISMGTYPALKYGSQLQAHAVIVAKPITNLGYVALRQRLQRPDEFDTIFDIDNQFINHLDESHLEDLDCLFWRRFEKNDLRQSRFFVGYMKNDDYDNQAVNDLKHSKALKRAEQVVYKGYAGRHNDNNAVTSWFIERVYQVLRNDFKRKM